MPIFGKKVADPTWSAAVSAALAEIIGTCEFFETTGPAVEVIPFQAG